MLTFDHREAVGEIEIGFPFEPARDTRAEGRARVVLFRVQASMRDVADERIAILPREVGRDDQLVHAVVQTSLIERPIADRARQIRQRAPERSVKGGAFLERPVGRAVAAVAALAAAVGIPLDGAIVPQGQAVPGVDGPVGLHDERPSRVAGRNDRRHTLITPVIGNRQARRRAVVEAFDAAKIEQSVRDDGPAQEPANPALIVRRRRVEEDRHVVRVVPGAGRGVEAAVLEESVRASLNRVRAAPGNHVQHGARRVSEFRREPVGHHLEFLDPILRK